MGFIQLFKKLDKGIAYKFDAKTGKLQGRDAQNSVCNVSRIDVACDDKAGVLDMALMGRKAVDLHEFNSRMTNAVDYREKHGKEWAGHSVYIGSEKSSFRLRLYDKALEQMQKGNWKRNAKGHWVRVEMVMRRENAVGFLHEAVKAESIGKLTAQVLNDKFRFIERDDSNISRCAVSEWWADFVEEVGSVVIWSRTVIQHPLHRVETWIRSQVSTSMAMIVMTMGFSRLRDIAEEGESRLSRRQEALVKDFNAVRAASVAHLQAAGALSV